MFYALHSRFEEDLPIGDGILLVSLFRPRLRPSLFLVICTSCLGHYHRPVIILPFQRYSVSLFWAHLDRLVHHSASFM